MMRALEILLTATLLLSLVSFFFRRSTRPSWMRFLPGAGLAIIILHLGVEGYRWQMVPLYTLAIILFFLIIKKFIRPTDPSVTSATSRKRTTLRFTAVIFGLLFLVFAAALPALFPVFRVPQPTGPYAIGTTRMCFVDNSREETFTPDTTDHRELLVQCWYPAETDTSAKPESFWQPAGEIGKSLFGKAGFLFDHLNLVKSHSYANAPMSRAQSSYPVLIFSHGYNVFPAQSTVLMEALASHGYIVFSIAHPYEAIATV
jgi:hypothetical protein